MKTATMMSQNLNIRRLKAEALVAAVMAATRQYVSDDDTKYFYQALLDVFMEQGVEVLTDRTRAEFGLPPRDEDGWTSAELRALEAARFEILIKPISYRVPQSLI